MITDIVSEILAPSVDGFKTALKPIKPIAFESTQVSRKPNKNKKPRTKENILKIISN